MTRRGFIRCAAIARDERGIAATEFALLVIPMCLVLMGGLDMGVQVYYKSQLQGALNDVARTATVETPVISTAGASLDLRIENAIKARVGTLIKNPTYTITKTNYYRYANIGQPERLTTDVNGNGRYDSAADCYEDSNGDGRYSTSTARTGRGGADDIVIYEVTVRANRLLPVMGLFGASPQYVMTARTSARNQPFANQPRPLTQCRTP